MHTAKQKLVEENKGEIPFELKVANKFLDTTPKA